MKVLVMLKRLAIVLGILGAIGWGVWFYLEQTGEPPLKFITSPVQRGDLRAVILATGKVQPVSLTSVGTQISGTLKELYVDYNSVVKRGQMIALIDPATQEAEVAQARAALNALIAEAQEARANLELAKQTIARTRELYERKLIAKSQLDVDETALRTTQARMASAEARVVQQRASLERAQLQLGYTRIYSPVDGVVVTKNVDVGQTVAASFNTPTLVEIAEDLSIMQVEVRIDEADIGNVYDGQVAEFNVDAFPERRFSGRVSQIRLSPATENNVISYTVIVSFQNDQTPGKNLIPGMTANVTLIVEEHSDVLIVPNAALRFRPLNEDAEQTGQAGQKDAPRRPAVYRLEKGEPVRVEIERGITDGANTEILSGLDEGTEVIVGIDIPRDA